MGKRMDFKAYGKLNVILWEEFSYGKINVMRFFKGDSNSSGRVSFKMSKKVLKCPCVRGGVV